MCPTHNTSLHEELRISQSAEFIRRVLESNEDCIKVVDLQDRLLYMNHAGQRVMEVDDFDGQAYRQPWLSFWQGEDKQRAKAAFNAACAGKTGRFDGYCATAKGTPKWWEVVVTPMLENGQVQEILSVSRDITARKQAELALQERNNELDDFTKVVSHDLKAPLRGISSLSEWILEDLAEQVSEDAQLHLNLLQQRVQRMHALVDGLLEVSRAGRQHLPTEEINVSNLLIDSLAPSPNFSISISPSLPTILGKKRLLSQVLTNLLSNALKHHNKTHGNIDITCIEHQNSISFASLTTVQAFQQQTETGYTRCFRPLEKMTQPPIQALASR